MAVILAHRTVSRSPLRHHKLAGHDQLYHLHSPLTFTIEQKSTFPFVGKSYISLLHEVLTRPNN